MTQQNISRMAEAWRIISRKQTTQADRDNATRMALQQCGEFLIAIHDMAEIEQRRYEFLANRLCDYFWQHNRVHRTPQTPGYPGHFGCRARVRQFKLECHWYYNQFIEQPKGSGKHKVLSHYLPRNGQFAYYKSTFTPAHDWEKPAILATEEGFALIRQLNDQLMQMRRLSRSSQRLLGALLQHLDEMEVLS